MNVSNRPIQIFQPSSEKDLQRYYELRWHILRAPWKQPHGSERDDLEDTSIHVMACDDADTLLGVGRLHMNKPQKARIRYMAVDNEHRNQGVGVCLLTELERIALAQGATSICLNARDSVTGFYEQYGYRITGPAPTLFGIIRHVEMSKMLAGK